MNLLQLRDELRLRMAVPATDALFTDAVCTSLVNSALNRTSAEADWPWLETVATLATADTDDEYTPPVDWLRTILLQQGDYAPLKRVPIQTLLAMTGAGRPTHYAIVGDTIRLRPTPNGVLNLVHVYISQEAVLAADGDTPRMPAVHHNALVEFAAYLGFRRAKNLTEAGGAKASYDEWKQTLLERVGRDSPSEGGALMPPTVAVDGKQ